MSKITLLSEGKTNAKTSKNALKTYILYLSPSNLSGINLCPFASKGCIATCLNTAGRGAFNSVQVARLKKTLMYKNDRLSFYLTLSNEIVKINAKAIKENIKIAIRLNGTSDVDHLYGLKRYANLDLLTAEFSNLVLYDYTKNPNHVRKYHGSNYHLTFSKSEENEKTAHDILFDGGNVAIVFRNSLPSYYLGFPVINGDETDLRYYDPKNVVVGLIAKGKAKKDLSGFVIG